MKGLITLCIAFAGFTGTPVPVHWTYRVEKISADVYRLSITASMDSGWHIYAQKQPKEAIAIPTSFEFIKNPLFIYEGKVKEDGNVFRYHNDQAGIIQDQYAGKVLFTQLFKVRSKANVKISGTIHFQACTDEECLPPQSVTFSLQLPHSSA